MPVFTLTCCRTVTLSLLFAFLKGHYSIIIEISIAIILLICVIPYCKNYGQMAVLGAITSLFGPCIVVNEFSLYFIVTTISSSLIYMSALAGLSLMIYFDNSRDKIMLKTEWPTAFKMITTLTNLSSDTNSSYMYVIHQKVSVLDTNSYFVSSTSLMGGYWWYKTNIKQILCAPMGSAKEGQRNVARYWD